MKARTLILSLLAVSCSRTPPEPAPATTTANAAATQDPVKKTAQADSRCITKLASVAPAIPPPAKSCPPDPEGDIKMPTDSVVFPEANSLKIEVELAKTPHDVEHGLMFRQKMGDDHGMLFKLDGKRDHTFWMHNTCIGLDMMFIDEDGLIVGIVEGAEPLTDSTRSVGCPSLYVLEVNAGWSRKHGIAPGQKIAIPFAAH